MTRLNKTKELMTFLQNRYNYNPDTGKITNTLKNKIIDHDQNGYREVSFVWKGERTNITSHTLAWILTYGWIPSGKEIDHINGIKYDNRLCNLRLATRAQNASNRSGKKQYKGIVAVSNGYTGLFISNGKKYSIEKCDDLFTAIKKLNALQLEINGQYAKLNVYVG